MVRGAGLRVRLFNIDFFKLLFLFNWFDITHCSELHIYIPNKVHSYLSLYYNDLYKIDKNYYLFNKMIDMLFSWFCWYRTEILNV